MSAPGRPDIGMPAPHAPAARHLHFVGIGGAGMSAIAEVMHAQGLRVTGSDAVASAVTDRLAALGIGIRIGHAAAHVAGADAVVASTAVHADNPELQGARAGRIPVLHRAEALAQLMQGRQGIAIAGTHGKTTTTSLVASVLIAAGTDPTFVIGGELLGAGANSRLGQGAAVVVEADESDASFLHLAPQLAVVTNIDADHMATYGHSAQRLHAAFVQFLHRLPADGLAIVCGDDPGVQAVLPQLERPQLRYGLGDGAPGQVPEAPALDVQALDVQALPGGRMQFRVRRRLPAAAGSAAAVRDLPDLPVTLNLAGLHNVRNALAAVAVAMRLGLPDAAVQQALSAFAGVGRRFQRHGELPAAGGGSFLLIDDYGHHPVELQAVLQAARGAFPGRRLVAAFQPHRYSRTRDCFADFVAVLAGFDAVLLTEVYAAGEPPIPGADGAALHHALCEAVAARRRAAAPAGAVAAAAAGMASGVGPVWVPQVQALPQAIAALARGADVVFTLGAGSIGTVPALLRGALLPSSPSTTGGSP